MKLAISNIAWDELEQPAILKLLANAGVAGIEIAPTKLWPDWIGATPEAAARSRADLAAEGFAVPALQSILFGQSDLHVFGTSASRAQLVRHVASVAKLAEALDAKVMVFGSPRNRLRGDLSVSAAMRQGATLFREIGAACTAAGTCLGIEANPREYGGDFLLSWREALAFVQLVDHPGIGLHFDTACTSMAGDDPVVAIRQCVDHIRHFHVSAPRLGPVGAPGGNSGGDSGGAQGGDGGGDRDLATGNAAIDHAAIAAVLRENAYSGWVSIEMRRTDTPQSSVQRAVEFVRDHYG